MNGIWCKRPSLTLLFTSTWYAKQFKPVLFSSVWATSTIFCPFLRQCFKVGQKTCKSSRSFLKVDSLKLSSWWTYPKATQSVATSDLNFSNCLRNLFEFFKIASSMMTWSVGLTPSLEKWTSPVNMNDFVVILMFLPANLFFRTSVKPEYSYVSM